MAANFKSIPIVDISPLLAKCNDPKMAEDTGVSEVVKHLDQCCRDAGFFYVKGHGISESLMKEVRDLSRKFFDLPYEDKIKIKMTASSGFRGYQQIYENITKGVPDNQEAIDYYKELKPGAYGDLGKILEGCNLWPQEPPNFKETMEKYINLCTDLSRNIMRGIALALGGSPYKFEGERARDAFWITRIIGYPGKPANAKDGSRHDIGCGAHTDYGLLALVNQDEDITALLVMNSSGEWIPAPPVSGAFVCNIGDMLKIYTNGLYESTIHRVINNSPRFRTSVAYFYEGNFDTAVEPLDVCKKSTGGVAKFQKAFYGEHLVRKVMSNFGLD